METVDETVRRKFESDWQAGSQPDIAQYLPEQTSQLYLPTLEELICIDLEFRWSLLTDIETGSQSSHDELPFLEGYLKKYPELNEPDIVKRLLEEEIVARLSSTSPPVTEEYVQRFPDVSISPSTFQNANAQLATVVHVAQGLKKAQREEFPIPFGKYVLTGLLGRGGMGAVYRAYDELAKRDVAIKVATLDRMPVEHRRSFQQRFQSEVRAAAKLSHDHVMPVFDVGEIDGSLYFTMPILDGDLTSQIREQTLSNQQAARYVSQAARGVEAAHAAGLLHRDIKPHNFMYDRKNDRVLVADFGLVRFDLESQQLTQTGEILGTPPYMAPEQIRSVSSVDARADVYSLGASLYHLLVGRPPFQAASPAETIHQVLDFDPVSPRELNSDVDRDLETICLRALQKEPELRFESADELAADLERYQRGEAVHSRPLSPVQRLFRWRRRHPKIALLSGGCVFLLLMVILVSWLGWYQTHSMFQRVMATSQQGQSSLNELFTFVRTEPLLNQPGQEVVRRELLDRGIQHYQALLAVVEENESISADIISAQVAIGLLKLELDGPEESIEHFERAIQDAEKLSPPQAASEQVRSTLGDAWNGLGQARHQLDQFAKAGNSFDQSMRIRKDLARRLKKVELQRKSLNALMNRAQVDAATGNIDVAFDRQTSAQNRRLKLLEEQPQNRFLNRDYAMGQFNLARLSLKKSEIKRGQKLLQDATARFRKLADESPTDARLWVSLVECLLTDAMFQEQVAEIPGELKEAIQTLQPLVMLAPENRSYRLRLTQLYQQAIEMLLSTNDVTNAEQAWNTMDEKLIQRFAESDQSPETLRVRLNALRQRGLISLGKGDRKTASQELSKALEAWELAKSQSRAEFLNSPDWTSDWVRLEKLRDSISQ